ncbi:MAG: DUF2889 domain-containing protein [Pseudomonadota bacterium]
MKKKDLIHERGAFVKIFELEENQILIEGTLTDERFCRSFIYSLQRLVDPDVIHRITVRMTLSLPKLIIESAEAEMPAVPVGMCREIKDVVHKLIGLRLTRGFKDKVKKLFGGRNGCIHMTNLILFMSTAAIQGSYTFYNRVREDGRLKHPDFDDSLIINSCHVWSEDGSFAARLVEMKKAAESVRAEKTGRK